MEKFVFARPAAMQDICQCKKGSWKNPPFLRLATSDSETIKIFFP
jgi:hypothetical protein